jgi:hypothetical protein
VFGKEALKGLLFALHAMNGARLLALFTHRHGETAIL